MRSTVERELKLDAPRGFRLPALPGRPLAPQVLTATYHDTGDHRLARAGVTLRFRVEGGRGRWQLKLPQGDDRLELETPGRPEKVPAELDDLVTALRRGRPLGPVARVVTRRAGVRVHREDDPRRPVADVVLDRVRARVGDREVRFSQVEVEARPEGSGKTLRRLTRALTQAGAEEGDDRPKLLRALEVSLQAPPEPLASGAPAAAHLGAALTALTAEVVANDPGTRRGQDPEHLHRLRVAIRRWRALLRCARPLLDRDWAEALRAELAWLGGELGPVRDLDVLLADLRDQARSLEPAERRALGPLLRSLAAERVKARGVLLAALRSSRYLQLLDRMDEAARAPRVTEDSWSLEDLVAKEVRRFRRVVKGLQDPPGDEEIHEVRIKAKRVRYAAELAEAAMGKPAARLARKAKALQDILGQHQDAAVSEARLRAQLGGSRPPLLAMAVGRLIERDRARRAQAREDGPPTWKRLLRQARRTFD